MKAEERGLVEDDYEISASYEAPRVLTEEVFKVLRVTSTISDICDMY